MFDFDKVINRYGTDCYKYDAAEKVFGRADILPMWVADMDFQSPPEVIAAAKECSERGVFGYTYRSDEAEHAFIKWVNNRHSWEIKQEWMVASPGVVTALSVGVRVFTEPGDKVMIMTPVYHPFFSVVEECGRQLACSSLVIENDKYVIDWNDFEATIKENVRMLIISNPHNPVGRQWTKDELERIGNLCLKYKVIILSDEIHSDLPLFGHKHTVMASVSEEIAGLTVTMMAPSKTFNIAGTMNSVVVISSPELRERFSREISMLHINGGNIFGHVTFKAAYEHGAPWLEALIPYLENNIRFTDDYIRRELPGVSLFMPECSFLLWMDFRGTGIPHDKMRELLINKAKIGLNNGTDFGPEGEGFHRMNIGCPLSIVEEGLKRIKSIL